VRLVFAGTPAAAVTSLDALLKSRHEVAAVVTRPDAPAGRGRRVTASPVAQHAGLAGLEVLRPARPRDPDFLDRLRQIAPACCPVTAYGALIPQQALDIPEHGWVNLHFSLLPAWRGAAPVQHAIRHGDDVTGATTFQLVAELDAGPVFGVVTEPIGRCDTAGELLGRLASSGAELLVATMDGIESGELAPQPQPAEGISLAPKLSTEDARIHWSDPALAVGRLVRACTPAPGAWTELNGSRIKLWPFAPGAGGCEGTDAGDVVAAGPGELRVLGSRVLVGTGTRPVQLGDVQQDGKRRMPAADWARGLRLDTPGVVLG
jgi:methionyl-tRNA formyltransferase